MHCSKLAKSGASGLVPAGNGVAVMVLEPPVGAAVVLAPEPPSGGNGVAVIVSLEPLSQDIKTKEALTTNAIDL